MPVKMTFAQAVNEALIQAMEMDRSVIAYGLGVDDPKRVFGTTRELKERFGGERVFDTPVSENALTGIAIGASLNGIRPVMSHQRLDFFLLAMDQLVNNAAKWHYMFGGKSSVPLTIRLMIGRDWGQGPSHSQNLQAWFAHIPGLKVVMPTFPEDAKGLLLSSIFDDNPVIYLEHRCLYDLEGSVPEGDFRIPLGRARRLKSGSNISLIAQSYMTIEALRASEFLEQQGITCDLIDLRSISPIDWELIFDSVRKTTRVMVLDTAAENCSVSAEIVARISTECFGSLTQAPQRLATPNTPTPTSLSLAKFFYNRAQDIVYLAGRMLKRSFSFSDLEKFQGRDYAADEFKGPF